MKEKAGSVQRKHSKDLQRIWRTLDQNIFKNYTKKSGSKEGKEMRRGSGFYTAPNTFYITFFIEHNISIKCSGYRLFTACFMVMKCKYLAYINM